MSTDFHTPHPSGANLDAAVFNTVYSDLDAAIRQGGAVVSASDPTSGDDVNDGYLVGTLWVNTTLDRVWQCVSNTASSAIWRLVAGRVGCEIKNSANQSVANNITAAVTFDTENFDTDGFFDSGVSNTDITVPYDGIYICSTRVAFVSNSTGFRWAKIDASATYDAYHRLNATNGEQTIISFSMVVPLNANDVVSLDVFQTSGGSLNLVGGSNYSAYLSVVMLEGVIN